MENENHEGMIQLADGSWHKPGRYVRFERPEMRAELDQFLKMGLKNSENLPAPATPEARKRLDDFKEVLRKIARAEAQKRLDESKAMEPPHEQPGGTDHGK